MNKNPGKIAEIIDKGLGENYYMQSIIGVVNLATRCVHAQPCCRPTITEVVGELREAAKEAAKHTIRRLLTIQPLNLEVEPPYLRLQSSGPTTMGWSDNSYNLSKIGR